MRTGILVKPRRVHVSVAMGANKAVRTILRDIEFMRDQVTELPGGEMRIAFHLDNLEEIEPWVLSWGGHATVVRPKALADRVVTAATGIQLWLLRVSG